jgi:hypothetical protein
VQHGTKLGPWVYKLVINGLNANDVHLWNFVDDTNITEKVPKGTTRDILLAIDELQDQSTDLRFTLNEDKCKEMRVSFSKSEQPDISPVRINNKEIDLISSAKILGLTIRNDLKWNDQVYSIVKKT